VIGAVVNLLANQPELSPRRAQSDCYRPGTGADSFPHLTTMDGNISIALKTQSYFSGPDLEHRDFEHRLETVGATDDH
jgi:hypothetical protein